MAKTSTAMQTRRIARERTAAKREAARKRADAEVDSLAVFMTAQAQRQQAEANMAAAVLDLAQLGNSTKEIAEMTDVTAAEINRLRRVGGGSPPTTSDATAEPSIPEQPTGSRGPGTPGDGQSELAFPSGAHAADRTSGRRRDSGHDRA
uniref:hypothetical protein n=1 Tax=Amycolatopsis sp. CA-293810 TaxID=3239926 RepID=UPI003F49A911